MTVQNNIQAAVQAAKAEHKAKLIAALNLPKHIAEAGLTTGEINPADWRVQAAMAGNGTLVALCDIGKVLAKAGYKGIRLGGRVKPVFRFGVGERVYSRYYSEEIIEAARQIKAEKDALAALRKPKAHPSDKLPEKGLILAKGPTFDVADALVINHIDTPKFGTVWLCAQDDLEARAIHHAHCEIKNTDLLSRDFNLMPGLRLDLSSPNLIDDLKSLRHGLQMIPGREVWVFDRYHHEALTSPLAQANLLSLAESAIVIVTALNGNTPLDDISACILTAEPIGGNGLKLVCNHPEPIELDLTLSLVDFGHGEGLAIAA